MNDEKGDLSTDEELSDAELCEHQLLSLLTPPEPEKMRIIGLYGDIEEEMSANAIYGMQSLLHEGKRQTLSNPEDPNSELITTFDPFEMYISTWGGVAMNMFAVYDCMRLIRQKCDIHTVGLGKVMSAGVLLLAAGTKGKRKIGANCRVMIHSVIGGHEGSLHNLENEMEEIRWIQNQHIKALISETDMTTAQLKKILSRKMNVYLDAEEAVELGIADEII